MKMNRTEWIGVILCLLAFGYFTMQSANQPPPKPATPPADPAATATGTPPADGAANPAAPGTPAAPAVPAVESAPEKTWVLKNKGASYTFSSKGGGIKEAVIHGIPADDKGFAGLTEQRLNVRARGAIGAISRGPDILESVEYKPAAEPKDGDKTVTFVGEKDGIRVTKTWTMDESAEEYPRPYLWNLKVTLENLGTSAHESDSYYVYAGAATPLHSNDWIFPGGHMMAGDEVLELDYRDYAEDRALWVLWQRHPEREVIEEARKEFKWGGVKAQYYTHLIIPKGLQAESLTKFWTSQYKAPRLDGSQPDNPKAHDKEATSHAAVGLPAVKLAAAGQPGSSQSADFQIYVGPTSGTVLNKMGPDVRQAMHYRGKDSWTLWGLSVPISRLFLGMLNLFAGWVHSYGIAIVLLTIVVRMSIFPLTLKAGRAMKRMAKLAPLQNELKEKYKEDPQKLQLETMKLFREYGVNPMGSCMPMLLQFPIFLGYYGMMRPAVEFRGHSFLWAHDLSMPDTVAHIAGFPINPLPLLMTITMYIQMAIAPKPAQMNPQMEMQMKIFKIMPFFFMFFCYSFASALALYWTVQNIVSILQTWYTNKLPEPELKKVERKPGFLDMARQMQEQQKRQQEGGGKSRPARTGGGGAKSAYRSERDRNDQ